MLFRSTLMRAMGQLNMDLMADSEGYFKVRQLMTLEIATKAFKTILEYSDLWQTHLSDMLKKEIILRVSDYEKRYKQLVAPKPVYCDIKL